MRPDVFRAVALMSAPFAGPPRLASVPCRGAVDIHAALAALDPPPQALPVVLLHAAKRTRDMRHCPQGLHAFLRAYYHHKSADWHDNRPSRWADGRRPSSLACPPTTSWT